MGDPRGLLQGKAFLALSQEVVRSSHDLLVKPAASPSERSFLDSTDMHLMRKCPCAVWITNETAIPPSRVLALVDPDPANAELNQRILQVASSLGDLRRSVVDVLYAWEPHGSDLLNGRLSGSEMQSYIEKTRERSTLELADVIKSSGVSFSHQRVHLIKGDVRRVVPAFVHEHEIGLVVMGTVCRTGIQGFLIGNTAETILSSVRCPVLTLKPRGFVSPIAVTP